MTQLLARHEIGSEFWDVPVQEAQNDLFCDHAAWYICGTAALQAILEDLKGKTTLTRAAVPSWCCSCMIEPFQQAGMQVVLYSVCPDASGTLCADYSTAQDCDVTLVMTYFGYTRLHSIGQPSGVIIRDLTHSLFTPYPKDAAYYFGSLRKWAGFWTGGFAWTADGHALTHATPADETYLSLRASAMQDKFSYLTGSSDKKTYLSVFEEAEDLVETLGMQGSCSRDIDLAKHLDAEHIRTRRRENASLLLQALGEYALFPTIHQDDCPMFVPILLPDQATRDMLRKKLIEQNIYCPIHWPISAVHPLSAQQAYLYTHSLSLVCDQRYDAEDMYTIVAACKQALAL